MQKDTGDARGREGRGGRDFRFFEKKLGKKLPCRVVALKAILGFIIVIKGYNPARKLLRSFSRKATTRPPRPLCLLQIIKRSGSRCQ